MSIDRFRTDETSYSDYVAVGDPGRLVFVAGQLAFDEGRQLVDGDVTAQAHRCLDRIEDLLVQAGGRGLQDIMSITVYLLRLADYPAFDQVRSARFGDNRPANAAVQVAGLLFGAQIEIAAVAFLPEAD